MTWSPVTPLSKANLRRRAIQSPALNETIDEYLEVDAGTAHAGLELCAANRREWARQPANERATRLFRWSELVHGHSEELAKLIAEETGKPIRQGREEAISAASAIRYYAGLADKPSGNHPPQVFQGVNLLFQEPIGTVLAIIPWNGPAFVTAHKSAGALAGGNAVVVKPSPLAVRAPLALVNLGVDAGIPEPALQCFPTGPEVSQQLVASDLVEGVSFTGSTSTGRQVAVTAAAGFKQIVLEMGGKSPTIIFADADLDRAAASTIWGVFAINGQDCCARSRAFVERSVFEEFLDRFVQGVQRLVVGNPLEDASEVGPLITAEHRERVKTYLLPKSIGPTGRVHGGHHPDGDGLERGNYLTPAVVAEPDPKSLLVREEVFGPVAAVMPFDKEEEAVGHANRSKYGLSASLWTRDLERALRVTGFIEAGQVSVNGDNSVFIQLPFGGEKASGVGRELGTEGMRSFLRQKSVSIALE